MNPYAVQSNNPSHKIFYIPDFFKFKLHSFMIKD